MVDRPILNRLAANNIVIVSKEEADRFSFVEACDYHYEHILTKAEMLQLIEELKEVIEDD